MAGAANLELNAHPMELGHFADRMTPKLATQWHWTGRAEWPIVWCVSVCACAPLCVQGRHRAPHWLAVAPPLQARFSLMAHDGPTSVCSGAPPDLQPATDKMAPKCNKDWPLLWPFIARSSSNGGAPFGAAPPTTNQFHTCTPAAIESPGSPVRGPLGRRGALHPQAAHCCRISGALRLQGGARLEHNAAASTCKRAPPPPPESSSSLPPASRQ